MSRQEKNFIRPLLTVALLVATIAPVRAQTSSPLDPMRMRGTVIDHIACQSDASQSYALYLPSAYSPERRWPVIYAFDPFARGKVPVELYKGAAEKYGYIVVGSNNAKNGPSNLEMEAAQAVWLDTHRLFAIDKDRVYTTGLSGAGRFATAFALYCYTCSIAGVISHGAGLPIRQQLPANDHFLYYVAVGDADFNYPEILELRRKKDEQGSAFKVKIYPGPHQWAPADVVEDAVEWLELKTMQAGKEEPDPAFVDRMFDKVQGEATKAKQSGDADAQYYALRSLVFDFKGLKDVSRAGIELAALGKSKELKKARRVEKDEIEKQRLLTQDTVADITGIGMVSPDQMSILKERIISSFLDLRHHAKSTGRDHLIYVRAINQLWIHGIETGQEQFRANNVPQGAAYFELMAEVAPDQSWPLLLLAETRVREGNKKAALAALQDAVKRGVKSPDTLTRDPELAPLSSEPGFQRLVESLGKSVPAS